MTLPDSYLVYPHRRPGMDHDRYVYSNLFARKPVQWPGGARIALSIVVVLEHFPLDMAPVGVRPLGSLDRPWPDLWNYTLRDYGNRVGVARIFRALEQRGLKASVALSSRLAERRPHLVAEVRRLGFEAIGHGLDMGSIHATGTPDETERRWVDESLVTLRRLTGQPVTGWHSPAGSQSHETLDLVAAAGCRYTLDWVNDDMPYPLTTAAGTIHAMPHANETSDVQLFHVHKHRPRQFVQQLADQFDWLWQEAARPECGGRIVALSLRPWVSGVPHRVAAVEAVLDHVCRHRGVWSAATGDILAAWMAQQG